MVVKKENKKNGLLFWLKERESDFDTYHAYLDRKRGTRTVCRMGPEIIDVGTMDIGGSRSKCCTKCFFELYSLPRIAASLEEICNDSRKDD